MRRWTDHTYPSSNSLRSSKLMDPLSDILTLMKPTGYGFRGLNAAGDWALAFEPAQGIRCFGIETGACQLQVAGTSAPISLVAGDVALVTVGGAVLQSSDAAIPVDALALMTSVRAGQIVVLNGGGECRGLGGFFGLGGVQAKTLVDAIPAMIHVGPGAGREALLTGMRRLMVELSDPQPGSALLAGHLAQALLVEALREHLKSGQSTSGWLAALAHPNLRHGMAAVHNDVARHWSISDMARAAGMSRSSFASHFERVTGATPMAYLTRWRMMLASELLISTGMSLPAVASSVGYESESAFGAAFKRITGHSPRRAGKQPRSLLSATRP